MPGLRGAIAAAITPLRDGGRHLDTEAFPPLVRFLAEGGIDGLLACGTTGEGVLLTVDERRRITELFLESRPEGFQIAVHAGRRPRPTPPRSPRTRRRWAPTRWR